MGLKRKQELGAKSKAQSPFVKAEQKHENEDDSEENEEASQKIVNDNSFRKKARKSKQLDLTLESSQSAKKKKNTSDVQMEVNKKKRKKSMSMEDSQNHDVTESEQVDNSRNETNPKKKKIKKNKNAEDSMDQLNSSNEYENSDKVTITVNIKKSHAIPHRVDLFIESALVKHKLKTLGIELPEVEVILHGENNLQKVSGTSAASRKQNVIMHYSLNHWKTLLPKSDVGEIKLVNTLLSKRRFKLIGLMKEELEQIKISVGHATKGIDETSPNEALSQKKELFTILLERLNVLKQQSWDSTEDLIFKKGDHGITDEELLDKVNEMFQKPYTPENEGICSDIENFILTNIPINVVRHLQQQVELVESLLEGKIPEGYDRKEQTSTEKKQNFTQKGRGFARGRGGFRGSFSHRGAPENFRGRGGRGRMQSRRPYNNFSPYPPQVVIVPSGGHFGSRGQGAFRGTFRGRTRPRGKISQTNFEAKQYAQKCKELNKVPELGFKGVDLNKISGYAASTPVQKK